MDRDDEGLRSSRWGKPSPSRTRFSFGPSISAFVYTPAPTTADHVPLVLVAAFDVDPARATEELYCATVTLDALSNGFAYHGEARAFATVGSLNIVGR